MKVRLKAPVTKGAKHYPIGIELELPDEEAKELIKLGLAEPIEDKPREAKKR